MLSTLIKVISRTSRGVHKRIDENRELLEEIYKYYPQVKNEAPWIVGWIEAQDRFLVELAYASKVQNPFPNSNRFPRPWPLSDSFKSIKSEKE